MILSKKLRVFFLSVLVVMLASSASMAALTKLELGSGVSFDVASKTIFFSKSGYYELPNFSNDTVVEIDEVVLTASADEVDLRLPAPYNSVPGEGIPGKWKITLQGGKTKRQSLSINKMGSVAAGILLSGDYDENTNCWVVPESTDLIINVPLKASTINTPFAISVDIAANAKFKFGADSNIYGKGGLSASGFVGTSTPLKSTITVEPRAVFEVESTSTLQGSLDVYVKAGSTSANNGRLIVNTVGSKHDLEGAMLYIDGTIEVQKDLEIADGTNKSGTITVLEDVNAMTKRGAATLTLGSGVLSSDIKKIHVLEGKLYLNGKAAYSLSSTTPTAQPTLPDASIDFTVSGDSNTILELGTMSIQQGNEDGNRIYFDVRGSAKLVTASHSIYSVRSKADRYFKEIYPYEDYFTKDHPMGIDITSVEARISPDAVVQVNGIQAFNKLTGTGTIEVNGTEGKDDGVVIFVGGTDNKSVETSKAFDFAGKINGTHANVGLWKGMFSSDVFHSADKIVADNLIIYGNGDNHTTLLVSDDTLGKLADVGNIYLRSDRPGANNAADSPVRSTMLTVGRIIFTGRANGMNYDAKAKAYFRETAPEYELKSLRVDATHVENGSGLISTDNDYRIINLPKVELYANKSSDFGGDFKPLSSGGEGMYAIRFGGAHSKINVNSDGLTGDGDATDVDKVFAIQVLESADVKMTGTTEYPFTRNNSVLVKSDAKLEVYPNTTIDGNITLEPSTNKLVSTDWDDSHYDPHDEPSWDIYPREAYFSPNTSTNVNGVTVPSKWNDAKLDQFTVFTTRIGAKNRRTNNGVYSVKVNGDITLSSDTTINRDNPSSVYPGKIVVRAKPDLDLLDGVDYTTGQITNIGERFKVLGLLNASDTYTPDFIPVYNAIYGFRIPRDTDVDGVIFELRKDVVQLYLDEWYFTDKYNNGDNFGVGTVDGYNFEIKIKYRSNKTYTPDDPTSFPAISAYFGEYYEGIEDRFTQTNVLDEANGWFAVGGTGAAPKTVNVSNDITFLARVDGIARDDDGNAITDEKGNYGTITLMGTSYQEVVRLVVAIADSGTTAVTSQYVVPSYKVYTFVRKGATPPSDEALQSSSSLVQAKASTLVEGETEKAEFYVSGMRKAPNNTASAPTLVGDSYVWNYGDANDVYVMKDSSGQDARVKDVKVVLYDGYYYMVGTQSFDIASFDFEYDVAKDRATIGVATSDLRGTAGKYNAFKQLAVMGTRVDGDGAIITNPATFTLFAASTGTPAEVAELDSTIDRYATEDVQRVYDIDYTDLNIGVESADKINLLLLDPADWLEWEGANDTIAYSIKRSVIQANPTKYEGKHTVRVLAYVGDNATGNAHAKVYTFTVTIGGYPVVTVSPASYTIPVDTTGSVTVTLTGFEDDNVHILRVYPIDAAPATLVTTSERNNDQSQYLVNIVGNSSAPITVNATSVDAKAYRYHISSGRTYYDSVLERMIEASADFTVTVTAPDPASVTISEADGYENQFSSPAEGYTYHAVYTAEAANFEGDTPAIEWSVTSRSIRSELYTFSSKDEEGNDIFVVEGIARRNGDNEQTFTVNAKAGSVDAEPVEVSFTVDEDPYAEEVTYPNTKDVTITGDSTAVKAGYRAMLPTRTAAASDTDVVLPLWLKPVLNDDEEIIGVEFAGQAGDLANGSKATVRIYAAYTPDYDAGEELPDDDTGDRYYGWDVVYAAKPADLSVAVSPATLSLQVGGTATATAAATDAQGDVTYTLSKDEALTWVNMSGATITVANPTEAGTYTVTVIARDSRGEAGQATTPLTITVTAAQPSSDVRPTSPDVPGPTSPDVPGTDSPDVPNTTPASLTITPSSRSVTFTSPSADEQTVTLSASNASGSVTYTAEVTSGSEDGLDLDVSGNVLTIDPVAAGTYTITVTGRTATQTPATATITVTVGSVTKVGSSSGGGCDAGFGALALVLAAPLFLRRRRS